MIISNLAVLLAERGLTIQKVHKATGISRPTLTSLKNNKATGIQFDTLNALCSYLNVSPDDILLQLPYDVKINFSWSHEITFA